ncbi:outer membrane beta-barrel family protein [Chitinophaga filiformis]|uniref:Outer membrane receptor proteins, mostly Fe transport n=1 Tax=Chitinophaga filiformis TaxID=104663 RepID=A0A1G8B6Y4_CHIFI|nr:outer membrane beta-barrel family protein [Chitinophaga filiformis]SDH28999.1 Outer membrane receptor proteins, mostly Fe transport [Chitinophaga filiformis]
MTKSLTFFCLFFLFVTRLTAQNINRGEISGILVDEKANKRNNVDLSLLLAKDSSISKIGVTDETGHFQFENVPYGNYYIAVMEGGMRKIVSDVLMISEGNPTHTGMTLKSAVLQRELSGVTVIAQKPLIERKLDRIILNVENSPLAAGNSALEVIGRAPGVSVDNEGLIRLKGKQGVNVLIDGKSTYLAPSDLANMLRATDGSNIQSVEIITNPSAKYDATGSSGIINIKLKKNKSYGVSGSLIVGSGYGNYYKGNTGISFNYRNKKVSFFATYNYLYNKRNRDMNVNRANETAEETTYFLQNSRTIRELSNNNFKTGIDYSISPKSTVGFMFTGYANNTKTKGGATTFMFRDPASRDTLITDLSDGQSRFRNYAFNLNYKTRFDSLGRELTVDLDYSKFNNKDLFHYDNHTEEYVSKRKIDSFFLQNTTPASIEVRSAKADYVHPFINGLRMELGVKAALVRTDNNLVADSLVNNAWTPTNRSNRFVYDENVYAGYLNLNKEFKNTKIQAGLRVEKTHSKGNSITLSKVVSRDYLNLFPTLYIGQKLGKDHELTFSYGRRINRPNYEDLNPFIYFVDRYTLREGNPFLNPQYSDQASLSYVLKDTYSATLAASRTNDVITPVLLTDTINKILYQTNQNLAKELELNLNFGIPVQIAKWWTMSNDITIFYLKYKTPELLGSPLDIGKKGLFVNSANSFVISKRIQAELVADYKSPFVYGTVEFFKPQFYMDMGINYSLLQKRANLKVALSDILNTQEQHLRSVIPAVNYSIKQKNETRVVRVTFTYRFGRKEVKAVKSRNSNVEEETRRAQRSN